MHFSTSASIKVFIDAEVPSQGTSLSLNSLREDSDGGNRQIQDFLDRPNFPGTPNSERAFDSEDEVTPFDSATVEPNAEPLVAVIGVGYVGEHLVESFSSQYNVIAFDISPERIADLEKTHGAGTRVKCTTRASTLREATHFLISVPTLLRPDKTIDSSYLCSALNTVAMYARPGSTVVVESSVAVGMTRALLGPIASRHRFFAGMSPERVDPGRVSPPMQSIPKVISGLEDVVPGSLAAITRLYGPVFQKLVQVSRPEVAEMMKLYENCQRMMCIAFANEMADACRQKGIDPFEVSGAAATKPFGYMPFMPSLGVGGHCIPVNPYYLLANNDFPLLKAATEKMWARPTEIARRALDTAGCNARILVVGIGFKRGQSVLSNSPGLELLKALSMSQDVNVMFADALVKQAAVPQVPRLDDCDWNKETLETFDMIIVSFKQTGMDFGVLETLEGVKIEMWCD